MRRCLVVLSGGQDSTTCLFAAKQECDEVIALTINYHQRHSLELQAAKLVAQLADVDYHEILSVGNILKSTSPLVDKGADLETYQDFDTMTKTIGERVELTFVPMRNALFLTLAMNRAVAYGARSIYTGVCQADTANYPDCRSEFINAIEISSNLALGTDRMAGDLHLKIVTPLMHRPKSESIRFALTMPGCYAALGFSHTAYDNSYPPVGTDHASVLRAHGFAEAGVPDPLLVRAYWESAISAKKFEEQEECQRVAYDLPATDNYLNFGDAIYHYCPKNTVNIPRALLKLEQVIAGSVL